MSEEEIVTSPQRHFIISLEGKTQDGKPWSCQLTLTPTGSSSTEQQDSFWTQLLNSLVDVQIMNEEEAQAFLQENQVNEPRSLWNKFFGKGQDNG